MRTWTIYRNNLVWQCRCKKRPSFITIQGVDSISGHTCRFYRCVECAITIASKHGLREKLADIAAGRQS